MSSGLNPEGVPPGAPVVPQGPVPAVGIPNSQDYPRLVYTAPRFEVVAIADIIEPSVLEACEALLPTLVPPYVNQAAIDAVNATAVRRAGDTMTGPLNLSPVIPTADAMAASKQYVDTMIATGAIPEVPPVPAGQAWARETGQWVPIAGGGTVTNIVTGAGLTGGPITSTGTIAMANMNGNTLKGNNTGAVAAPTDLNVGQVMTMLGAAPLNSPTFTGSPTLPTGTQAVTQPGGTSDTTVATTAFVASSLAAQLISPAFTGNPTAPTPAPGDNDTSIATTAFVGAALGSYLPLTGGRLSGGLASGPAATAVPGIGALTLNANTVAPAAGVLGNLAVVGSDNGVAAAVLDSYGTNSSQFVLRHARNTAAVPQAVQNGDALGYVVGQGYNGAAMQQGPFIALEATETWSGTARGSSILFATNPAGGTAGVNSLTLQGNQATFSGGAGFSGSATFGGNTCGVYITPTSGSGMLINVPNTSTYITFWQIGGTHVGDITTNGSAVSYNTASDVRLKENVVPVDPAVALDLVARLVPVEFDWTTGEQAHATGFIAQDAYEVFPDAISPGTGEPGEEDFRAWGMDNSKIVPLLVGAIHGFKAEFDALKAEFDALKAGRTA